MRGDKSLEGSRLLVQGKLKVYVMYKGLIYLQFKPDLVQLNRNTYHHSVKVHVSFRRLMSYPFFLLYSFKLYYVIFKTACFYTTKIMFIIAALFILKVYKFCIDLEIENLITIFITTLIFKKINPVFRL